MMARPTTLFTGQWADMTLEVIAEKASRWGYDGIELPCWGDHFNVQKALHEPNYSKGRHELLGKHGLKCWAISNHLTGQLVLDHNDARTDDWVPAAVRGDAKKKTAWAIQEMKDTAKAAQRLGVKVVNGFTGSSIWHLLYSFPPVSDATIDDGFQLFADRWNPILDVFKECDVKFALEVHPTEIAFDLHTAERALKAVNHRPEFGFNFDPSHLHWQMVDPVEFIRAFPDRIYHVHVKDAARTLDGRAGILGSHLNFGDPRRGWDFRSPGRGQVNFEEIARALNQIGYEGPLSVEWEDCGMDREYGAAEAARFVKEKMGFKSAGRLFDSAFADAQAKA
jgi:sugar phosphate isomerase/epimerase